MQMQYRARGRAVGLAIFALAALVPLVIPTPALTQMFDPSEEKWQLGYIPLKDGINLAYIHYQPRKEGRYPVLITYNSCLGGATVLGPEEREYLARGYAVLGVSMRGTGSSEGAFTDPFAPQHGADGKAVLDWVAEQPWCDGNVGLYGNFDAGVSQLQIAAQRPKCLKALAASQVWGDTYEDFSYPGGIFNFGLVGEWSYQTQPYLSTGGTRLRQFRGDAQGARVRAAQPITGKTFAEMQAHPYRDNWWALLNFADLAKQVEVPTLVFQAWQDPQVSARGALRLFENLYGPKRILLSNGGGAIFAQRPLILERVRWFDHWLKGKPNGIEKEPPVTIWFETREENRQPKSPSETVSGTPRKSTLLPFAPPAQTTFRPPPQPAWVSTFSTWPIPGVEWSTLYLTADGRLDKGKPAPQKVRSQRSYLYPAGTEIVSTNTAFSAPPAPVGTLVYRTSPLPEDLAIVGAPVLTLYASSEQNDTDFMAVLHDINPQGQVTYVQRGFLRASHRALDAQKSTPHAPIHRHDRAEELTPGQVYELQLALFPLAHVLRRGHALELAVLAPPSIPSPSWAFTPVAAGLNTLYHTAQYPSRLELPVLPKLKAQAPEPALGSLPLQPVREQPVKGWDHERKNLDEILQAWKRERLAPG